MFSSPGFRISTFLCELCRTCFPLFLFDYSFANLQRSACLIIPCNLENCIFYNTKAKPNKYITQYFMYLYTELTSYFWNSLQARDWECYNNTMVRTDH